ncbi:MAG: helicase-associated domain-containing protein [Chloroflexi bacterium]|nr:helicase-associated domain-containing protein [Chloroflexota bacterium]
MPRLTAIADTWDIGLEAASAGEMAEALAKHMLVEDAAGQGREVLPIGARKALDALVAANGRMPAAVFERRYGTLRPMGPGRLERERPWLSPANPTEVLWYRGFIFRAFDRSPSSPVEVVFVPTDLLGLLPQPAADAAASESGQPVVRGNQSALPASDPLLDDVTTILTYIQNYEVRIRGDGGWNSEARTALLPMLRDPDGVDGDNPGGRFGFMLNLIGRMHWLRIKQSDVRLMPQAVTQWLQGTPQAQRAVLFGAWRNDPNWNDLAHVQGIAFEMPHAWANDAVRERTAILDLLVRWVAGNSEPWQEIDAFVDYVKRENPDFARPDGRYDTWHIRDVRTNEFLNGFENWDRVEGALIRYILTGPLRWLGTVNVQNGRIALTEAAKVLAVSSASPDDGDLALVAPRPDAFRLEPDGDVIVHTSARFERFQLARVANWSATRAEDYVYRLAPESVNAAMKQGITAPRIVEFLQQHSSKPVPPNLMKAVKRLAQFGAEARLEQAYMLRTRDAATLDLLLNTHAVRKAMIERLSPTCALMRQREVRAVASAIIRTGLLIDL